jgi:hypothetical protein
MVFMRLWIVAGCLLLLAAQSLSDELAGKAAQKGRAFLVGLLDADLGLLPEYAGARTYWLYHDNYLALKVLADSHPQTAASIRAALQREKVKHSGKIELLFGEATKPLPFCTFRLVEVRRAGNKRIMTEYATQTVLLDWQDYADLLLLAALAETNAARGRQHLQAALRLWDGKGFNDRVAKKSGHYATYKLALALLAAAQLKRSQDLPQELPRRLLQLQDRLGGWITDYDASGKPVGKANVETTCLAILALERTAALSRAMSRPMKASP